MYERIIKHEAIEFYLNECVGALPNKLSRSKIDSYVDGLFWNDEIKNELKSAFIRINEEGIIPFLHYDNYNSVRNNGIIKRFYDIIPNYDYIDKRHRNYYVEDRERNASLVFDENDASRIRSHYGIDLNEIILFIDEHYYDDGFIRSDWVFTYGIVITDAGIYCRYYKQNAPSTAFSFGNKENDEQLCFLSWEDFNKVVYKELVFYFYSGNELVAQIEKKILCDGLTAEKCKQLAEDLTSLAHLFVPDLSPIELAERGQYKEALGKADNMIKTGEAVSFGHFSKAYVLREIEIDKAIKDSSYEDSNEYKKNLEAVIKEFRKTIKELEVAEMEEKEKKENAAYILFCIASTESLLGRYVVSREQYIEGLGECGDDDKERATEALLDTEKRLKETWDNYTSLYKYKDRKFIMPVRDSEIGGCVANGITTFRMSNIPSCMKFPMGHPTVNQLYIGHPFNPSLYMPFEQSEELFFLDKVHEFRYLLECLGAEEITITSIKGKEVTEFRDGNNHYEVDGGVKRLSVGVEVNTQYKNQNDSSSHSHRSMIVKLDPLQKPFLPDGLIWYNEMPQWQRLVQSRLHGNLLEYSEFVSTAETKFTSSSEMTDIKASAKFLWAKAHAEVNECFEKQFKESIETQWKVDVKFRSMKGFENQMSDTIKNEKVKPVNQVGWSKEEENYAEEVKFCLEDDGVIDDSERRLLERKRIKFGISQKRAAEIENSLLQSQLTEDEQEYLEAVKEELVGGKIPEASRRLLERLRKRMEVSDERAKEIEIMAMKR